MPDEKPGHASLAAPIRSIYAAFLADARWLLAGIAVAVLAAAGAATGAPFVFSRLVDELATRPAVETALAAALAYAVLLGMATALQTIVAYLGVIAAQRLSFIAGTQFFARIVAKRVDFFTRHNPAQIETVRARGESALYIVVQLGLIYLLPGLLQLGISLAVLGAMVDMQVALIVLIYGVVFIGLTYAANIWVRKARERGIEASNENARFLGNAVTALETLRYFDGEKWLKSRFEARARAEKDAWEQFSRRRIVTAAGFGLTLGVQVTVTFWLLLPRVAQGELSVGDLVLFNALMLQLNHPFEMIGMTIDELFRGRAELQPFADMWSEPEDSDDGATLAPASGDGTLRFETVSFRYGETQVLSGLSFLAERGRITFLTGSTGAGKSTAFRLALRSLTPASGRVVVEGHDLQEVSRSAWYQRIGVVPQDVVLLNDTLERNIVLGREADPERVREALRKASILDFVTRLPEGLATNVGERGLKLSGGERQRIAIARALYGQPEFLFLDEASSALDDDTEAQIMQELRHLQDEVTILAITHRRQVIAEGDLEITLGGRRD